MARFLLEETSPPTTEHPADESPASIRTEPSTPPSTPTLEPVPIILSIRSRSKPTETSLWAAISRPSRRTHAWVSVVYPPLVCPWLAISPLSNIQKLFPRKSVPSSSKPMGKSCWGGNSHSGNPAACTDSVSPVSVPPAYVTPPSILVSESIPPLGLTGPVLFIRSPGRRTANI